jgi:ribonuclease P protein component
MRSSPAPAEGPQSHRGPGSGAAADKGLSRRQRVTDAATFREAFDGGQRYAGACMVLLPRRGKDAALRLGVVASRKTLRRAVDRARAKRLMREAYRLNRFRFSGECDVVLIGRQRLRDAALCEVERDLLALARRAGLLRSEAECAER